jgi:hypothetical protein
MMASRGGAATEKATRREWIDHEVDGEPQFNRGIRTCALDHRNHEVK